MFQKGRNVKTVINSVQATNLKSLSNTLEYSETQSQMVYRKDNEYTMSFEDQDDTDKRNEKIQAQEKKYVKLSKRVN